MECTQGWGRHVLQGAQNNIVPLSPVFLPVFQNSASLKSTLTMHLFDRRGAVIGCCSGFRMREERVVSLSVWLIVAAGIERGEQEETMAMQGHMGRESLQFRNSRADKELSVLPQRRI